MGRLAQSCALHGQCHRPAFVPQQRLQRLTRKRCRRRRCRPAAATPETQTLPEIAKSLPSLEDVTKTQVNEIGSFWDSVTAAIPWLKDRCHARPCPQTLRSVASLIRCRHQQTVYKMRSLPSCPWTPHSALVRKWPATCPRSLYSHRTILQCADSFPTFTVPCRPELSQLALPSWVSSHPAALLTVRLSGSILVSFLAIKVLDWMASRAGETVRLPSSYH